MLSAFDKIKQEKKKKGMEGDGKTGEDTLGRTDREDFPEKLGFEWGINEVIEQGIAFWMWSVMLIYYFVKSRQIYSECGSQRKETGRFPGIMR